MRYPAGRERFHPREAEQCSMRRKNRSGMNRQCRLDTLPAHRVTTGINSKAADQKRKSALRSLSYSTHELLHRAKYRLKKLPQFGPAATD